MFLSCRLLHKYFLQHLDDRWSWRLFFMGTCAFFPYSLKSAVEFFSAPFNQVHQRLSFYYTSSSTSTFIRCFSYIVNLHIIIFLPGVTAFQEFPHENTVRISSFTAVNKRSVFRVFLYFNILTSVAFLCGRSLRAPMSRRAMLAGA